MRELDEYGMDENSYKQCPKCDGERHLHCLEFDKLYICEHCSGEGDILMEYEEYKEKVIDDRERDALFFHDL